VGSKTKLKETGWTETPWRKEAKKIGTSMRSGAKLVRRGLSAGKERLQLYNGGGLGGFCGLLVVLW